MNDYQERARDEHKALGDKIVKLADFLETDIFKSMCGEDKELLADQLVHMARYSNVLSKRILRFKIEEVPKTEFTSEEANYLCRLVELTLKERWVLPVSTDGVDLNVLHKKLHPPQPVLDVRRPGNRGWRIIAD